MLTLTKDTLNHALWNPSSTILDDQSGELAKFSKRFSGMGGASLDDVLGLGVGQAPKVLEKKVVEKVVVAAPAKGKAAAAKAKK
ncbi:hypothetical protein HDV03_000268 [Kappamyces sp. JEL0829]|nr:hypothetical protein HDV03_000268 [Kappamyces sp. JEL0829]KAJ3358315.1 hypothetical protein HDU91_005257 [Kappamyces sp. JEL0680]